jgi:hypothetical protein
MDAFCEKKDANTDGIISNALDINGDSRHVSGRAEEGECWARV